MYETFPRHIVIVGAGFSGAMVAVHLLRSAQAPLKIILVERYPRQFARGVAYSAEEMCHRLNVPSGNMSAYPDEPDHFLDWARAKAGKFDTCIDPNPTAFLPRQIYGEYIRDVLKRAQASAAKNVVLESVTAEVQSVRLTDSGDVQLDLSNTIAVRAQQAVLALGNFRPGNPAVRTPSFYQSEQYIDNPWAPAAFSRIPRNARCLFIGSGLTMVDWVNALSLNGHTGALHVISRHGLAPLAHRLGDTAVQLPGSLRALHSVRAGLREFRELLRTAGDNWRACIDALRPLTQELWSSLPLAEKRRFLRHLRPYWDQHRHRLAPDVAKCLVAELDSGLVRRHVGRVVEYHRYKDHVEATIEPHGPERPYAIQVDAVINCCGAESDYRKLEHPLVRSLLESDLATVDELGLGLKVDLNGALIDRAGRVSERLFTLGPPQKGTLWETTAVPEIRGQAQRLATRLLKSRSAHTKV